MKAMKNNYYFFLSPIYIQMPYYIRANGQSRTKEQLMTMLANNQFPDSLVIASVGPGKSWTIDREGDRYSVMTRMAFGAGALPIVLGAVEFVPQHELAAKVQGYIQEYGANAVAVNAPPAPNAANNGNHANNNGNHANNNGNHVNNNGNHVAPLGQPGGRRRSQRRRTNRRRSQRSNRRNLQSRRNNRRRF